MPDGWLVFWSFLFAAVERSVAVLGVAHVILHKRDARAAACWAGLIVLTPLAGTTLYVMFGINRLRRKGGRLQSRFEASLKRVRQRVARAITHTHDGTDPADVRPRLVRVIESLTQWKLLPGNTVEPLLGGDEAYPAMLAAIDAAQHTVGLCSYIFDDDRVGGQFIDALERAQRRGVAVRVLIDDMGSRFLFRSAVRHMESRGIHVQRFLPALARRTFYLGNLRNHRKILVVDGDVGFTGGMNIQQACAADCPPRKRVLDMHFRIRGPVVTHMTETFAADWLFANERELLIGESWFPAQAAGGPTWARGVPDGPDDDFQQMLMALLAAIEDARGTIDIVTPYFLPEDSTLHALHLAALRGVRVRVFLPEKSDHLLVQWATSGFHEYALEAGCEVYLTPPPFDHTKLLLIDDDWSLIGSTNWDPRSMQLNFEFNIECHDTALSAKLHEHVEARVGRAKKLSLDEVRDRWLPIRLRDGAARLLTPYL